MTDIEMVRLCAQAMGYKIVYPNDPTLPLCVEIPQRGSATYNPLADDTQALKLVKKFRLSVGPYIESVGWCVWDNDNPEVEECQNSDLNRAIVECVALMKWKELEPVLTPLRNNIPTNRSEK